MQQRQEAQASALRRNPMTPGPRGRWTGRTYTAAHPLEFAAGALGSGIGAYQEQKARDRQKEILQEQADLRGKYMNDLIGALKARGAGPGAGGPGTMAYPMGARQGTPTTGFHGAASGPGAPAMAMDDRALRRGWTPLR